MSDYVFKLSDDPKDLVGAAEWASEEREKLKKQREVRDRAKERLRPFLEEAAKKKAERLATV